MTLVEQSPVPEPNDVPAVAASALRTVLSRSRTAALRVAAPSEADATAASAAAARSASAERLTSVSCGCTAAQMLAGSVRSIDWSAPVMAAMPSLAACASDIERRRPSTVEVSSRNAST